MSAAQKLGIAEQCERQAAGVVGAQQRKVGVGIDAQEPRLRGAAFGVGQADVARAVDHVRVGQRQPIGGDDDARAGAAAASLAVAAAGVDAHDRRPDGVHDRGDRLGIGVEQDPLASMLRRARLRLGGIGIQEVGEGGVEHLLSHL